MSWLYWLSGSLALTVFIYLLALVLSGEILMTAQDFLQIAVYLLVLLALVKPLGAYMARIYQDQPAGCESLAGRV